MNKRERVLEVVQKGYNGSTLEVFKWDDKVRIMIDNRASGNNLADIFLTEEEALQLLEALEGL